MVEPQHLPRLLYVGDVPVENTYHGSLQLYRLLETYPKERLAIMEAGNTLSSPDKRLPGVAYIDKKAKLSRLRITRLASVYFKSKMHLASLRAETLLPAARRFAPEAILTVSHEVAWLSAAALARRLRVQLHLICHDEWAFDGWGACGPGGPKDRLFQRNYRAAASHLCISPYMAEENEARYGVAGEVLYPCRSLSAPRVPPAPPRRRERGGVVCGYAGSIQSNGLIKSLDLMAQALRPLDGKLLIFGPFTSAHAKARGLDRDNIQVFGHADRLIETLRDETDVLYLPMSFAEEDRANMRLCFPSKLADYTLAGLPIVILSPTYGSAAQWAVSNPNAAELVTQPDASLLQAAVARIARDPVHHQRLGAAAMQAGEAYFSHASAFAKLCGALTHVGHVSHP